MYKIDVLLKQDRKLFHTKDLALLWRIDNLNTLYTTIKRYVQKGILTPIHKGFYATVPVDQIDPMELGMGYLHQYAYVSTESVLFDHGVIFQKSDYITLVGQISKKFMIGNSHYLVRKMADVYLFQTTGITANMKGIRTATLERAVADILYFNSHYHFDNRRAVDWLGVKKIQKEMNAI